MVKTVMPLSIVYNDDILGICGQTILLCLVAYHVLQGILASLAHWHGTPVAPPLSQCDNRKLPSPLPHMHIRMRFRGLEAPGCEAMNQV